MTDRQTIITALECCKDVHQSGRWASGCISCGYADKHRPDCFLSLADDAVELLKEQEPKTGHWIFESRYCDAWSNICSECGRLMTTGAGVYANYCSNCGAKMTGGEV